MMKTKMIDYNLYYDKDMDILNAHFLPHETSYDDEKYPGIIVRRSMIDERITGVTILDYSKYKKETLREIVPILKNIDLPDS